MAKKDHLTEELNRHFGFGTFKGNQKAIIENVLAGKDTFVLMPTGGGKSLCYQLPSILMEGTAIVISPLIALIRWTRCGISVRKMGSPILSIPL